MPAKIVVEPMERSLPTSVAYRSDRITSFRVEYDAKDRADVEVWLASGVIEDHRKAQLADLDAQEAALRAKYAMPEPRVPEEDAAAADLRREGGDFTTAAQIAKAPPPPGVHDDRCPVTCGHQAHGVRAAAQDRAAAGRATPPPSALRDVSDGTADELRRLGLQLTDLGHPYDGTIPSSEGDAQALLPVLRAKVFDLKQAGGAAPPPRALPVAAPPPAPPLSLFRRPDGADFQAGATMKGTDRKCGHKAHSPREPRFISPTEWDTSQRVYGEPLCQPHMTERRMAAPAPGGRR